MIRCNAAVLVAAALLAGCEPAPTPESADRPATATPVAEADYIGSASCAACHQTQHQAWMSSHHQKAMLEPSTGSVVGDFADAGFTYGGVASRFLSNESGYFVNTDGPDGELGDFEVAYTFGIEPLQQYLLSLPGGRLQALGIAWDSRSKTDGGQRWFHLHPDEQVDHRDVLHWTRDSQNWNYMCADCHSTNIRKNYDKQTNTYDTSFSEITVGCEACHGPASNHVGWATTGEGEKNLPSLAAQPEQINACAPCHSRRSQLAEEFRPQKPYLDHYLPALLDPGLYHSDGQILDEVYVYGSFLQSKMHERGVTCSHCHEPHSAELRIADDGLCTQCHSATGRSDFPTLPLAEYDSADHHFHAPDSAGARCVACHMPAKTYMEVDARRDHSFRIPRPDLTATLGIPNTCNGCHADQSAQWAQESIAKHFGSEPTEHYAPVLHAARRADPNVEPALAALAEDTSQPAIVRATAVSLMTAYGRGATAFALKNGLRDSSPLVRIGALRGAERWEPQRRWQEAEHLLDDPYLAVRVEAARVLSVVSGTLPPAEQSRLSKGIAEYLGTQSLHADRAEAQTNMATVFAAMGEPGRAEQALLEAMRLNPQWIPALANLADLYRATGRDVEGGPLLDRGIEAAPDSPDLLLAKALWLVRQQRTDSALPLLARATDLAPGNTRFAYVYGVALHSSGQSERAIGIFDAALVQAPGNRQLLEAAASIARETGDTAKMQGYLERLQRLGGR